MELGFDLQVWIKQCKSDLFLKVIHYQNIQMLQVLFGLVSNNTCACVINLQSTFGEWQIFDPLVKSTQKTETTCWEERYIVQSFKQSQVNLQCFQHTFLQLQQASMSVLFLKKKKERKETRIMYHLIIHSDEIKEYFWIIWVWFLCFSLSQYSLCVYVRMCSFGGEDADQSAVLTVNSSNKTDL